MSSIVDGAASAHSTHRIDHSRRRLLKGLVSGGLMLAVAESGEVFAQSTTGAPPAATKYGADRMPGGVVDNPLVFVTIAVDGTVTVVCHRSEMGEGVRTSVPLVVAEELEADIARVQVTQAIADESRYGNQNTDGSRRMRHWTDPMRRVGAAARQMLEAAAAARWNVPVGEVVASNHQLVHVSSGRRLGFGDVAEAAANLPVPKRAQLTLKSPDQFRYIGKGSPKVIDASDIVRGKARFGIDVRMEGLLHAVVARPPVVGGKLKRFDSTKAMKVPGVLKVVEIPSTPLPAGFNAKGGVAVIARNTWSAMKGRDALEVEWEDGINGSYDSEEFKGTLEKLARSPGKVVRNDGDAMAVLTSASKKFAAEYYIPHLAHATMEPPCATARVSADGCEVWAPVQAPQATRDTVAKQLGLAPDKVIVNVTLLGGGFGRKSKPDFVVEAALLSKAMEGKPVKVQWTRDDDLQHGYYAAAAVEHMEAALDEYGKPVAWLHRSAAPSIMTTFSLAATTLTAGEIGMTAINVPYQIPNVRVETPQAMAHTRIGWFRSVFNVPHAFAVQSFVSELAANAKRDPKDYLLELIGSARRIDPRTLSDSANYGEDPELYPIDTSRMRRVVEMAATAAKWGRTLPKGRGLGIATAYSFMTYTATVIEVEVSPKGELKILAVDMAIDCGPQINVERIRSQVEGAAIMGLTLALHGEITFKQGRVQQSNFHDHELMRHSASPRNLRVHLAPADSSVAMGGVGEPPLPPVAPALTSAIFAATGKRIRQLPIKDQLTAG